MQTMTPATEQTDSRILLHPSEAAKKLSLSRAMIYRLIATGELYSVRIGRSVRIPAASLETFVSAHAA